MSQTTESNVSSNNTPNHATVTHVHERRNGQDFYTTYYTYNNGTQDMVREELKRACMGKYQRLMDLLGCRGFKSRGDIRQNLMLLLQVVLAEIDEAIVNKINQLRLASKQMKELDGYTTPGGENYDPRLDPYVEHSEEDRQFADDFYQSRQGKMPALQTETSIIQSELTMLVQRRQQIVDTINNAIKSIHDSDMNTVRRIV